SFALVIAAAQAQHKLFSGKQFAVNKAIHAHPGQKEAAHGAASKMDVTIPIGSEGMGPATTEPPSGVSITALAGDLTIVSIASTGHQGPQISIAPIRKRAKAAVQAAIPSAHFYIAGAAESENHAS